MRSVRFVLATALAVSAMGGAVVVAAPAQAAKEKPLVVVPSAPWVWAGERITLATTGGPSKGTVRYAVSGNRCAVRPTGGTVSADVVRGATCTVVARMFNSRGKVVAKSEPITVEFRRKPVVKRAFNGQPCTIVGTPKADVLRGTPGDDVICGLGGNDRIIGRAGDDVLDGGLGVDALNGGSGDNLCDYDADEQKVGTCSYDDSPPEVSLSVRPGIVDATAPGAETRVVLTVSDEGGARRVEMQCHRFELADPNAAYPVRKELVAHWGFEIGVPGITGPDDGTFAMWQFGQVLPDDRWSWTADRDAMTFDLRLPIGRAVDPGPVTCSVYATDRLGHWDWTVIDNAFQVTASSSKGEGPSVESLLVSPSVIDMTRGGRKATAVIAVDAPTGIADFQTGCLVRDRQIASGTNGFGLFYNSGGNGLPYAGSEASHGPHSAVFTINQSGARHVLHYTWPMQASMPSGTYDCYVEVTDHDGQRVRQDFVNVVTLADSDWRDVEGPALTSITLSPNVVDVGRKGQDVTVTMNLADATGVQWLSMSCYRDDPQGSGHVLAEELRVTFGRYEDGSDLWYARTGSIGNNYAEVRDINGGDSRNPSLSVNLTVPFGYLPAAYSCYLSAEDDLGNRSETHLPNLLTVNRTWG